MKAVPKFEYTYSKELSELYVYSNPNFCKHFCWFLNTYHPELKDYLTIMYQDGKIITFNHVGYDIPNFVNEIKKLFNEFVAGYDKYISAFNNQEIVESKTASILKLPFPQVTNVEYKKCIVLTQYDDLVTFVIVPEYENLINDMEAFPYVLKTVIEKYEKNNQYFYVRVTLDIMYQNSRYMYFNELEKLMDVFDRNENTVDLSIWEDAMVELFGEE